MAGILDDTIPNGLFGAEFILPVQFWGTARIRDRDQPERRLMLAVLQDAFLTLVVHAERRSRKSRRVSDETRRWFASDSRAHPFAFAAICDVIGLDVGCVRSAVRRRVQVASLSDSAYRRDYAGRGRHQVERLSRSALRRR